MRLGVVLTGIGACAAASAGALTWLLDAGVAPYAVCGMQAAAWPAALYLVGYDADRLRGAAVQAARAGRRLLTADASARDVLGMKKSAICRGRRLEKLLAAQTGERALGLCERQGVFLCRAARSGHVVAFCTQSMTQDGAIVTLQASTAFAARAALSRPPFVSPMEWMGSPLLPMDDVPLACRLLRRGGVPTVEAAASWREALEKAGGRPVGGIGNIKGAVVGALMLGVLEILLVWRFSALSGYKDAFAFIILIAILIFKPTGLFGETFVDKV